MKLDNFFNTSNIKNHELVIRKIIEFIKIHKNTLQVYELYYILEYIKSIDIF